jgi:hypothetical protein
MQPNQYFKKPMLLMWIKIQYGTCVEIKCMRDHEQGPTDPIMYKQEKLICIKNNFIY